jgi:SAM-dependent methyltransferase
MTGASPPSAAFDAMSSHYDTALPMSSPLVTRIRQRVHAAIVRNFPAGSTLLELGCGTGEDTLALAARGYRIVATDPAAGMVERSRVKLEAAGDSGATRFLCQGMAALASTWPSLGLTVDGVFSNFAPLNCELSLAPLRRLLERALPRGGRFLGVVLPRLCPLEIALFLARGAPRTAFRRFARRPVADVEGRRFEMRYYGARDFDRALGGAFRRVETRSLGLVLPPLTFLPALARAPRLSAALCAIDDAVSGAPLLRRMGDHVLLVYERV